ncbi:hypothetical protein MXB_4925 [Myxobolus squamalis]|nr:hypothetical protein MXB_4925 [Myxobolus squamalis]
MENPAPINLLIKENVAKIANLNRTKFSEKVKESMILKNAVVKPLMKFITYIIFMSKGQN